MHSQLGSPQLGSLDQFIQMFPSHEVTFLKDVLVKNGTISDAVAEIILLKFLLITIADTIFCFNI